MTDYGSNIKFAEAKNDWVASVNIEYMDTIFIRDNKLWKKGSNYAFKKTVDIFPHETIHQILWDEGLDSEGRYDRMRNKILRKRSLSKRMRDYYYRCM